MLIVAIQLKEGRFTALDLLEVLGLEEARAYFEKRLHDGEERHAELYEGEKDGDANFVSTSGSSLPRGSAKVKLS